jgi:ABC-type tungstate transport system permease subunit
MANLRVFLALAASMDLHLFRQDIDTTFMHAPIKEDDYIKKPMGFTDGSTKVCYLQCYFYGLKQSPREFNVLVYDWLISYG